MNTLPDLLDPHTLADDLLSVSDIYERLFMTLDETCWETPVKGKPNEWTLKETVAHLCALNGAGLDSIKHSLRGEPYTFIGLDNRYEFNAYNRRGINALLGLPMDAQCANLLRILNEAGAIARNLRPDQAELKCQMAIYNRPVLVIETLNIIAFHLGLVHSAQVAEPAGEPPLWTQLTPDIRHRMIERSMLASSLLYRFDIGGELCATIAFRIDGPGGGEWFVEMSPDASTAGEGDFEAPGLVIHLRETAVFCRMMTSRLNLALALISKAMRLSGDLLLFLRMNKLFSIDARPKVV